MENKKVGYMILGIATLLVVIILMFNSAMENIVDTTCSMEHASSCPMYTAINQQTYLALAVTGLLVVIGLILIFSKPEKEIIIKEVKEKKKSRVFDLKGLRAEDKKIFNLVKKNGTIFQANIIEESGFGKAKISRIIDRLENKDLVERKRRGMTNVVVLKED